MNVAGGSDRTKENKNGVFDNTKQVTTIPTLLPVISTRSTSSEFSSALSSLNSCQSLGVLDGFGMPSCRARADDAQSTARLEQVV